VSAPTSGERFSASLRRATRREHERAESAPFVTALLSGSLGLDAYAALLAQSLPIYTALERAGEHWTGHPVAGPFVRAELLRRAALEADLAWLLGPDWRRAVVPLPATERYVERIRAVCSARPSAFVAHHYTRYLGDLSGGQIVRARLRAVYGLVEDGVRFYRFSGIEKPGRFRDEYRARLDATPWTAADRSALITEANLAFVLNREVFEDLGRAVGLDPA
jgi:heme oxygenase (biliverdin-producing, ferredoxin)